MGKKCFFDSPRRERVAKKIFKCQRNGIVNVHQVARNSFFSEREIVDVCEYLVMCGVLRANHIGRNIIISYTVVKNIF